MNPAVKTAEQVARQVAIRVKHLQLPLRFGWVDTSSAHAAVGVGIAVGARRAQPRLTFPGVTVRHVVELLRRALTDAPSGLVLRPLPEAAADLLLELRAPARLGAHLRVVHDVACQLTAEVSRRWPDWAFDAEAVHFGAAVHDVGKVIHPGELSGPGSAHELAGWQLLIDRGLTPKRARFARTHASWRLPEVEAEDLLVSLADKIWKGHRVKDLEQTVIERIALPTGVPVWQAFLDLDDILDRLANAADERLAYQSSYPALLPPSSPALAAAGRQRRRDERESSGGHGHG